jgi:hypothetical protein
VSEYARVGGPPGRIGSRHAQSIAMASERRTVTECCLGLLSPVHGSGRDLRVASTAQHCLLPATESVSVYL